MYFKARLVAGQTLSGLAYGFWLATAGIYFIDKGLELLMVGLILGKNLYVRRYAEPDTKDD